MLFYRFDEEEIVYCHQLQLQNHKTYVDLVLMLVCFKNQILHVARTSKKETSSSVQYSIYCISVTTPRSFFTWGHTLCTPLWFSTRSKWHEHSQYESISSRKVGHAIAPPWLYPNWNLSVKCSASVLPSQNQINKLQTYIISYRFWMYKFPRRNRIDMSFRSCLQKNPSVHAGLWYCDPWRICSWYEEHNQLLARNVSSLFEFLSSSKNLFLFFAIYVAPGVSGFESFGEIWIDWKYFSPFPVTWMSSYSSVWDSQFLDEKTPWVLTDFRDEVKRLLRLLKTGWLGCRRQTVYVLLFTLYVAESVIVIDLIQKIAGHSQSYRWVDIHPYEFSNFGWK